MYDAPALPDLLRTAGAVMTSRDGALVAAHYGSPAGELAVCVSQVGIADRADLGVLEIEDDGIVARLVGADVAPGGVLADAGVCCCRHQPGSKVSMEAGISCCRHETGSKVSILGGRAVLERLATTLRRRIAVVGHGKLVERSDERAVLQVVGRETEAVVRSLGVWGETGDRSAAPPFVDAVLADIPVSWLLHSATSAFVIVDADRAARVWQAIGAAGQAYGMSCVGVDSIDRYALLERERHRAPRSVS